MEGDTTSHSARGLSRRQWLILAGASASTALAGCGGEEAVEGQNGQRNRDVTVADFKDVTFVTTEFNTIRNLNYNPFDVLYFPIQSPFYLFGQLYTVTEVDGRISVQPGMAKVDEGPIEQGQGYPRLQVEDAQVDVPLHEDHSWHDGTPVTARDVVTRFRLMELMEYPVWDLLEDVEVVDDHTVRFHTVQGVNEEILLERFSTLMMATQHDEYEQFVPDEPVDEMNPTDRSILRGKLLNYTVREDVTGWGPWQMEDIRDREMIFVPHEDHPLADRINFPRVKFEWFSTKQSRAQNLLGGNFSGYDEVPNQLMSGQVPAKYREYHYRRRTGWGWAFNYDHPYFEDRRIRQAFAFAMDKDEIVRNSGLAEDIRSPHSHDTGFYTEEELHRVYFGDDILDELTVYDQDTERAAELLRAAGWQRDGGQWYDSNGEPASVTIRVCNMWPEQLNMANVSKDHLQAFGIDAQVESQELVVFYGQTMINADYDMAAWIAGAAEPNPHAPLSYMWNGSDVTTDTHNHPEEVEVPMPVGDPDGDLETVNVQDLLSEIPQTPADESQELYRKLVWTYNQWLPVYCINEESAITYLDSSEFTAPDPDQPEASAWAPVTYLMHRANVQAIE